MTRPLIFIDTETTGLHPTRRPWEIAIIRRTKDGDTEHHWIIWDINLSDADPQALDIGKFWERHPAHGGPENQDSTHESHAAREIFKLTKGATIIGAIPSFDTECVANMLRRHGLMPAWHHRLRCVESMTAGRLGREPYGLRECADTLDIHYNPDDLHTALGDTRLTRNLWDRLMIP